jgi:hypothetical protein
MVKGEERRGEKCIKLSLREVPLRAERRGNPVFNE